MAQFPMPFNNPTSYANHGGVDYGQPVHKPVLAIGNGVITYSAWWNDNAGYTRTLTLDGSGLQSMSCHLVNLNGPTVGKRVKRGDVIAYVGNTGRSTGPHLHHELWHKGKKQVGDLYWKWIDPRWVVSANSGGGGSTPKPPILKPTPEITDEEEDEMALKGASYKSTSGEVVCILFNEVSGFWVEHSGVGGEYNNPVATDWGTGGWPTLSNDHVNRPFTGLKARLDDVRLSR